MLQWMMELSGRVQAVEINGNASFLRSRTAQLTGQSHDLCHTQNSSCVVSHITFIWEKKGVVFIV